MQSRMEDLKDVYFSPLPDTTYVRPFRFHYTQDGRAKTWDMLEVHDSVTIVIFNVDRKVLVFVKQFRPAVYFKCIAPVDIDAERIDTEKYPAALGVTTELCAGIVDKDAPLNQVAKEEVLEETGYDVPLSQIERVTSYRSGVGIQGSVQTLYYCEVRDAMRTNQGGGVEDELIEVTEMSIAAAEQLVLTPATSPLRMPTSCLFGIMWFLHVKAPKYRKSFERHCVECKRSPGSRGHDVLSKPSQ